jgi:branched-subunit amino acid aminotransferase/4-amino-4-deoxychorismate lyase
VSGATHSSVNTTISALEGLRLYDGCIFKLNEHLERLEKSARALLFQEIPALAVFQTPPPVEPK